MADKSTSKSGSLRPGNRQFPRNQPSSKKCSSRLYPLNSENFQISDTSRKNVGIKCSEAVRKRDLISEVGRLWSCANHALPVLQNRTNAISSYKNHKESSLLYFSGDENVKTPISVEWNPSSVPKTGIQTSKFSSNDGESIPTLINSKKQNHYSHVSLKRTDSDENKKNLNMPQRFLAYFLLDCREVSTLSSQWLAEYRHGVIASMGSPSKSHCKTEDVGNHFVIQNGKNKSCLSYTQQKRMTQVSKNCNSVPIVAKPEYAFAGALSGVFVSLCLHPIDTVKTVIQSCHVKGNSINLASKSIFSDRGLMGFYRGVSSNIASAAPISALYTFTYESVKGTLLPLLPKEQYSIAHCVAGACSSIATSFIFTPSERIKQQLQVGSHYKNFWTALAGIIKTGGLPSLYVGWNAVIFRNVPHSVIKFYTYESLKRLISSSQLDLKLSTFQTLVCGGLAGCTASIFTTPFDVVKTRLQTQVPGAMNYSGGIFNTLRQIATNEGLKGMYRGLLPRFFMYLTQGALFFASYESFKKILCLDDDTNFFLTNDDESDEDDHQTCL